MLSARHVTGTQHRAHIMTVWRQLHWLPVRQRIEFKLAVLVYKALNGLSPQYVADDCQCRLVPLLPGADDFNHLSLPCVKFQEFTTLGDRLFTAAVPHL